jgi:hypothetical protein
VLLTPTDPLTTIRLQERTMAASKFIRKDDSRFWAKVNKTNSCWLWIGCKTQDGYGFLHRWIHGRPKGFKAHKYSWLLNVGKVPHGINVLHTCHVRDCVNPSHLYLGTQKQNMQDAVRRFGGAKWIKRQSGQEHPGAKLSNDDVIRIRAMLADGMAPKEIAGEFSVSKATISMIRTGRTWRL